MEIKVSFQEEYLDFEDLGVLLEHILIIMSPCLIAPEGYLFDEKPTYHG